jgi:hypothetical protein
LIQQARVDPGSLAPTDVLQLQRTIGNQAVGGLLAGRERNRTIQRAAPKTSRREKRKGANEVPHITPMKTHTVQGQFDFKKQGNTINSKSKLVKIHGVKPKDLELLANDDDHDYGVITTKADVAAAMVIYDQRHQEVEEELPLDESIGGHLTVREEEDVNQTVWVGNVRMTFQLDYFQGKHDQVIMAANSAGEKIRPMHETQMRQSKDQYEELAEDVPLTLAVEHLGAIFLKGEREVYDFAVMKTQQSDSLFYEISAKWATLGLGERHILVYYHCFPAKDNQKKWGYSKK